MFLEISQWDSSCRRIDEEGAALAPMIRDIGFEHVLKIFRGHTTCSALLWPCTSLRRFRPYLAGLLQLGRLGGRVFLGSEEERLRNDRKGRETKGNEWKRQDCEGGQAILVGALDTLSVGTRPPHSSVPAHWLERKILSHDI